MGEVAQPEVDRGEPPVAVEEDRPAVEGQALGGDHGRDLGRGATDLDGNPVAAWHGGEFLGDALGADVTHHYQPAIRRTGAGLDLSTDHDSTVDQGLTLQYRQMQEQEGARTAFDKAAETTGRQDAVGALTILIYDLGLDPTLHKGAEICSALKSELKADRDRLMAGATKAKEALLAKRAVIKVAADAEREQLAKKRQKQK